MIDEPDDPALRLGLDPATLAVHAEKAVHWLDDLSRRVLPELLETMTETSTWEPEPGDRIGSHRIVSVLGRGGMGVVYRAHDERLDRLVAIKFVNLPGGARDGGRKRVLEEARAAAGLDHPGIAAIHEVGESADGRAFIVMAHCDGETLEMRIARGPLGVGEAVSVGRQLADALAAAHRAGIIHRDVKPSNVILTPLGRVKVIDFGIAGRAGPHESHTGAGTGPYMSPEQVARGPVDARTDVWSLGVVLYEMLAGNRPFRGESQAELFAAIGRAAPEPLAAARPDVPPRVADIIARCLGRRPEDRFETADAVLAALIELGPGWPERVGEAVSRRTDTEANDHYRMGRHFLDRADPESVARARDHFMNAVNADPTFAPAWCGLSDAYEVLAYLAVLPPEEAHLRARAAAERALELDPQLAAAHVSLATVLLDYYRDWSSAEAHYLRALELDPDYATGRQLYAEFLRDQGRFDEALDQIAEAVRLDPLSPYFRLVRGIILHMARRPDAALAAFDRLLEATPDYRMAHFYTGLCCLGAGRYEESLAAMNRMDPDGTFPDAVALRGVVLARTGRTDEAGKAIRALAAIGPGHHVLPFHYALVHMALGDVERAITLLEEDADRRSWFSRILGVDPIFDPIREHPRFRALLGVLAAPDAGGTLEA